jgi:hypothetical protein
MTFIIWLWLNVYSTGHQCKQKWCYLWGKLGKNGTTREPANIPDMPAKHKVYKLKEITYLSIKIGSLLTYHKHK